jgi:thioredoxin reductase (NADPH)
MTSENHYDAIVIGAGPAGLTAGMYLSRSRLKSLVIDEGIPGGQMVLTHEIANYPGIESISGYQLSSIMKRQALAFGCEIKTNVPVRNLDLDGEIKSITFAGGTIYTADSVILAPGGRPRTLGVPGEDYFKGKGISYCATCDGDFFTDKEIIVVGGGNSALEEAVSLTKYANKVTVVHQFDHFQAFEHAIGEAAGNPKISFMMESEITGFYGNEQLETVDIKNLVTGGIRNFKTDGAFIFIGYVPNTEFLRGKVKLNQYGGIITANDMSTSVEGVFAAGDSIVKHYRQITTAVSDGTVAALAASGYLNEMKLRKKQLISH